MQSGATIKELSVLSRFEEGPDGGGDGRPAVYRNIVASALFEEYCYRADDMSMRLVLHNRDYDGQKITAKFEGPMKGALVQIEASSFDAP